MAVDTTVSNGARVVESSVASDAATILLKRISWAAVFAGVVLSLIAHMLLNMLGLEAPWTGPEWADAKRISALQVPFRPRRKC